MGWGGVPWYPGRKIAHCTTPGYKYYVRDRRTGGLTTDRVKLTYTENKLPSITSSTTNPTCTPLRSNYALNRGTRWRWAVSFTPQDNGPSYPLDSPVCKLRRNENHLSMLGIERGFLGHQVRIPTMESSLRKQRGRCTSHRRREQTMHETSCETWKRSAHEMLQLRACTNTTTSQNGSIHYIAHSRTCAIADCFIAILSGGRQKWLY
jgi:hypothetical protein